MIRYTYDDDYVERGVEDIITLRERIAMAGTYERLLRYEIQKMPKER